MQIKELDMDIVRRLANIKATFTIMRDNTYNSRLENVYTWAIEVKLESKVDDVVELLADLKKERDINMVYVNGSIRMYQLYEPA